MAELWEKRHAKGGKYNEPPITTDGIVKPHAITIDPETNCWHWNLSCRNGRVPQAMMTLEDGSRDVVSVRRYLWSKHKKEPLPNRIDVPCDDSKCVNPEHYISVSRYRNRIERAIELYRTGMSTRAIAEKLQIPLYLVYRWMREMGVEYTVERLPAHYGAVTQKIDEQPAGISTRDWNIYLDARTHTLGEVAKHRDMSRERIRQIVGRVVAMA
jgi:hypothetical protein